MKNVTVKTSKIHGRGVFADRDFKKGEVVIKYRLKLLTKGEFANLTEKDKHFTSFQNGKYWFFPSPERYVNHSCRPNTNPNLKNKSDFAVRNIKKGEEITTDYRKDNVPGLHMKCNCGSKRCAILIKNELSSKLKNKLGSAPANAGINPVYAKRRE